LEQFSFLIQSEKNYVFKIKEISDVSSSLANYLGSNHSIYDLYMSTLEDIQIERQHALNLACSKIIPSVYQDKSLPNEDSLYNNKYKFTICLIQKVASSNWLRAVMVADGFYTKQQLIENSIRGNDAISHAYEHRSIKSINSSVEEKLIWKEYSNILTVRSPMERVVSGYEDKMVSPSPYYQKVADFVESKYRIKRYHPKDRSIPLTGVPTFEDFINFLTDSENKMYKNDMHWASYEYICNPCMFKYDYILKLETLQQDANLIRAKLNAMPEDYSLIIPVYTHPRKSDAKIYFDTLPDLLIKKFIKLFQFDFEAFGYQKPNVKYGRIPR